MKKIPLLKKKAFHDKVTPGSLAMALNWDKIAKESLADADLDRAHPLEGFFGGPVSKEKREGR